MREAPWGGLAKWIEVRFRPGLQPQRVVMAVQFSGRGDEAASEDDKFMKDAALAVETGARPWGANQLALASRNSAWTRSIRGPPRPQ
jgi:hypothetical protein